jgi:hypothetical protein
MSMITSLQQPAGDAQENYRAEEDLNAVSVT